MGLAFVFPGQGSQSVGMLADLAGSEPAIAETLAEASELLGYDLLDLILEGPAERLNATECTQPAMLAAGVALWRAWRRRGGPEPDAMAGHSLGEYSALVCSGALEFGDAVPLVRFRAEVMQAATPLGTSAMAAVLGLDDDAVLQACQEAAQGEVVEPANFNSPGQVVIAGHIAAVQRALELARSRGAKRAVQLPVSVPAHTRLMQPAAQRLAERIAGVSFRMPDIDRIYAFDGSVHDSVEGIRAALVAQLHRPVHWTQMVRQIVADGARTIVECGPGKVLTGLNKRITRGSDVALRAIDDDESIAAVLAEVKGPAGSAGE